MKKRMQMLTKDKYLKVIDIHKMPHTCVSDKPESMAWFSAENSDRLFQSETSLHERFHRSDIQTDHHHHNYHHQDNE